MALPTFVNAAAKSVQGFGTSISPALPGSRVNGNLLICLVANGLTLGKIYTFPGDWTVIDSFADGDIGMAYAYRFVDGTEASPNITWTGNTEVEAKVWQFSGTLPDSDAIGNFNAVGNPGFNALYTNPGLETGANDSLVFAMWWGNLGAVSVTPTGYTAASNETHMAAFYQGVATGGDSSDAISQALSASSRHWNGQIELRSEVGFVASETASETATEVVSETATATESEVVSETATESEMASATSDMASETESEVDADAEDVLPRVQVTVNMS